MDLFPSSHSDMKSWAKTAVTNRLNEGSALKQIRTVMTAVVTTVFDYYILSNGCCETSLLWCFDNNTVHSFVSNITKMVIQLLNIIFKSLYYRNSLRETGHGEKTEVVVSRTVAAVSWCKVGALGMCCICKLLVATWFCLTLCVSVHLVLMFLLSKDYKTRSTTGIIWMKKLLYQSYHKGSTHTFVSHTAAFILEPTQTISFYLTLMAGSFTIDRTKD